jgi:putative transposase
VIGTVMQWAHELPGTTFSNPAERGTYDADGTAALTLRELERWLTLAVVAYHGNVHGTLHQTPTARWAEGVAQCGPPPLATHATAFLVDFLPVLRRTLTRTGFVVHHVRYFADALEPWIARRESLSRFLIRRDPRDISRIWVLEPEGQFYLEVPYRTMSRPAITLWEHSARRSPGSRRRGASRWTRRPCSAWSSRCAPSPGMRAKLPARYGATPSGGATSKTTRPGAIPSR